jgi:methionyl aminopeptidase
MGRIPLKTPADIARMREACRIVAEVLSMMGQAVRPGAVLRDLDAMAEEYIRAQGGVPAFKGYGHDPKNLFPGTLCVSVDEEVVHGIPDGRRLEEGQVVSVDVGVKKDGWFGDGARTFAVGRVSEEKRRLLAVTEESLAKGIEQVRPGSRLHDVSAAVQRHVEAAGFSIVRDLVGHGIGRSLHEEPSVPNFGVPGTGPVLAAGMTLAIEPMVNVGTARVEVDEDGWTVRTTDRRPSAHFEHTVAITQHGVEILTRHGEAGTD